MMTNEFIKKIEKRICYKRKGLTKGSLYMESGIMKLLPNRINLVSKDVRANAKKGRALKYQYDFSIKAVFINSEHGSPYQLQSKGSRIQFTLWKEPAHPFMFGFSSIGRTNAFGKMEDTDDLVVAMGNLDTLELLIYPGGYPHKEAIFNYLRNQL